MKFWTAFKRRNRHRAIEITPAGKWYLAMTLGIGIVMLSSGNNIFYLIESLLLGALILSGVLSEKFVSGLEIELKIFPASAATPARDQLIVTNTRKEAIFCIEVGEWKEGKFTPTVFISKIDGKTKKILTSKRVYPARGTHDWDGMAIATSYPFGFARKIRIISEHYHRTIWPAQVSAEYSRNKRNTSTHDRRGGREIAEAEIRNYTHEDDARNIVWIYSAKNTGHYIRPRNSEQPSPIVTLDLRQSPGEEFENQIVQAAQIFYEQKVESHLGTLIIKSRDQKRTVQGKNRALTTLALVQAEGES